MFGSRSRFRRSVKIVCCLVATAALVSVLWLPRAGAQNSLLRDHSGKWQAALPLRPQFGEQLSPEDRAGATVWVNQILGILHRMPMLQQPRGYDVVADAHIELLDLDANAKSKRGAFVTGEARVALAPYEQNLGGVLAVARDAAATVTVAVNSLRILQSAAMGNGAHAYEDAEGVFMNDPPQPSGELHGYPVYEEGNGTKWVLLTRNRVPLFAPVTRERFLKYALAEDQAALAGVQIKAASSRSKMPRGEEVRREGNETIEHLQQAVALRTQQLASMPQPQRSLPAVVDLAALEDNGKPLFVAGNEGTAILYLNPALMDARLPRSAPQIIAVSIASDADRWPGLAEKLDGELDWASLERLLR